MKRWATGAAAAASFLLAAWAGAARAQTPAEGDALVRQGAYVAVLADCAACHTARGGPPFAGGLEMTTPFGVIHSTNITPDPATGIGGYSFEQFDRAVRRGVAADGHNLYPVMPYPSFAKISKDDMRALYAYFQRGVAPVRQSNAADRMRWPFSLRSGLMLWNLVFAPADSFRPDPARTARWNRGAYLMQGPGHCGACHTPRGFAFQERAMDQDGSAGAAYLAGSTIDAWHAPALRGGWPAAELVEFLKTGRNARATAYGSMAEVVHFSTQRYADEDLAAIAEYLGSLAAPGVEPVPATAPVQPPALFQSAGGLGYVQFCAACHHLDGRGVPEFFPPLAGNSSITSADPTSVLHVVLAGGHAPRTERYPRAYAMPAFAPLEDEELAQILTFVRSSWGNRSPAVSAQQVHQLRETLGTGSGAPQKFRTQRLAALLASPDAERLAYGLRLILQTRALLPRNVGNELDCNSCHVNGGTKPKASPFAGVAAEFPRYAPRAGREIDFPDRVNACFRRSMHGKPLEKASPEMAALVAYMAWMRSDAPAGQPVPGRGVGRIGDEVVPDAARGRRLYEDRCAACHGDKGEGRRLADGSPAFPPLAGAGSYNIGAGMSRTHTAAGFVRNNMPIAETLAFAQGEGGLSDQEAVDVAEYFTHLPRPDYPDKRKDWPKGGKPKDARY